jgi:hypothetical protein
MRQHLTIKNIRAAVGQHEKGRDTPWRASGGGGSNDNNNSSRESKSKDCDNKNDPFPFPLLLLLLNNNCQPLILDWYSSSLVDCYLSNGGGPSSSSLLCPSPGFLDSMGSTRCCCRRSQQGPLHQWRHGWQQCSHCQFLEVRTFAKGRGWG